SIVQLRLDLEAGAVGTIIAEQPVEFLSFLRIDGGCISRTCIVGVFPRIETQEFRHPGINCPSEGPNDDPTVQTLERVVGLKPRGAVARVPVYDTLAGEQRHAVALRLRNTFKLGHVDYLSPSRFLDLPEAHHRSGPRSEGSQVISGVGLGPLRRTAGVASYVHHPAVGLSKDVVAGTPQVFFPAELTIGADTDDDQARVYCQSQFIGDAGPLESPRRRGLHPDIRDLPEGHQQFKTPFVLRVET